MPFPLFLALKYLKPKRSVASVITSVSVLGVVLGVAIIIIVRAVMTGFGDTWQRNILDFKPHITISAERGLIRNEEEKCRLIEAMEGVTAVSPGIETRVLVEHDHRVLAPIIVGVDATRAPRMMKLDRMISGRFDLEGDAVVMGVDMAAQLGVRAGDTVKVYSPMNVVSQDEIYLPEVLTVTGVFDSGHRDFDNGVLVSSLAVLRDLMGVDNGVYSIHVKVRDPRNMTEMNRMEVQLRASMPGCRIQSWREVDSALFNAIAVEKNMMVILLVFITVVAMFCVMNTLLVLTVQKTDEIGLLKALGFSSSQVMGAFVLHGWIQCIAGIVLGIGLAFLVLNNLQNLVDLLAQCGVEVFPKSVYGLDGIPWRVIPAELVQVVLFVITLCTVASLIPAGIAARKDPVQALHDN